MAENIKVLVLGAGYAGMRAMLTMEKLFKEGRPEAGLTLLNKHDYHQFLILLHEPAAKRLKDCDCRVSIREVFQGKQVVFRKATAREIDREGRRVLLEEGEAEPYDYLIAALGSFPEFFNVPGLQEHSFTLRSLNTARQVRTHVEDMFARSKGAGKAERPAYLTIVIGGAGLTGVEVAGEMADWVEELCSQYDVPREEVKLFCVEASQEILPGLDKDMVDYARGVLEDKGVRFLTGTPVTRVSEREVELAGDQALPCRTLIWAGGVRGNPILEQSGLSTRARGRVVVNEHLQSVDDARIFVTGDCALVCDRETGRPLAPNAQFAIQEGEVAARNVHALAAGGRLKPFHPQMQGLLVSLGRGRGVGRVYSLRARGLTAALAKEAVPLKYLYDLGGPGLLAKKFF